MLTTDLVLLLALLGAVLGLDVVSFPQAMVSRPIVAATAAGALLGRPLEGLFAGAALELIALETLPFGASRYPEWGSASVVGGALFASQPDGRPGAMTLAVLGALATAWVGGWSMVQLRRFNASRARASRESLEAGSVHAVLGLQLLGMLADFLRAGALTLVAFLALRPVVGAALEVWAFDARLSRAVAVGVAGAVAAGAVWKLFHAQEGARWFLLGGLAVGLLLVRFA